jgi:protein-tyrosine sulfotransferase
MSTNKKRYAGYKPKTIQDRFRAKSLSQKYSPVTEQTKSQFQESFGSRLANTRIGDLLPFFKRLCGGSALDPAAYDCEILSSLDSTLLHDIAYRVRGENYRPAIFVHGVMPRSGTNYVADLLKLHTDTAHYPHRIWEFPLLHSAQSVNAVQQDFLRTYKRNAEVIQPFEFLALLASGFLRYLQELAPAENTVVLKVPHAEYLYLFHALFPRDHLILVMRDGRDAIASHQGTFSSGLFKPGFAELCQKWAHSTSLALDYEKYRVSSSGNMLAIPYEKVNQNPQAAMREIIETAGLLHEHYDFNNVEALPVRGSSAMGGSSGVDWEPKAKPSDFKPVGRWHGWGNSQKRRFKRIAGKTLIAAGYAADNSW